MKQQQLHEALALLLTKLSSARDNPLLMDNYAVKALSTVLLEFKESGEIHEAYKEQIQSTLESNNPQIGMLMKSFCYDAFIKRVRQMKPLKSQRCHKLEVYAEQTNNITHQHKTEVIALTLIEEVEAYDIIKDYPDKLVINI